jgi:hypothetical protein
MRRTGDRTRSRLIRAGSVFLFLFAILPSVTFVGHGPMDPGGGHAHQHEHQDVPAETDESDHAAHCHEGVSRCADQSSLVGTWWIGESDDVLSFGGSLQRVDASYLLPPLNVLDGRILQPPRAALQGYYSNRAVG